MMGTGETYLPAFVLAVGLGEILAGLASTLPLLAGAVLQLASPFLVRRLRSHKRWVVLSATIQAVNFLPLMWAAWRGSISGPGVLLLATVYWAAGMGTTPAWNTWIGRLVPQRLRARFFARRTRTTQIAMLAAVLGAGGLLNVMDARGQALHGFGLVFLAAAVFRLVSVTFLSMHTEPAAGAGVARSVSPRVLLEQPRHAGVRLLVYMLAVQMMAQMAAPYFTSYMVGELRLAYVHYTLLLAAFYVAKIMMLPALGRLARRFGTRRLLWLGGWGIVPMAGLWAVSSAVPYLVGVQLLGGVAWAAYELATFLMLFETIAEEERTSMLTIYNVGHALATVTGSAAGAVLLHLAGEDRAAYLLLFLLSTGGRLLILPLLWRVVEVPAVAVPIGIRAVSDRLVEGPVDVPILASIPHAPAEQPARPATPGTERTGNTGGTTPGTQSGA